MGETYIKKYVAYNAIEYDDAAYLQKAIEKIADELGFELEIRNTQLDLFDLSLPEEKIAEIRTNTDMFNIYQRIIDIDNNEFYYQMQAIKDDADFFKQWNVSLYRSADLVLNFDADYFTNDNMKEITRNAICDLLVDESFSEVVDYSIDDTYIKITKGILGAMSSQLKSEGKDKVTIETIDNVLNSSDYVYELATDLQLGGENSFYERLCHILVAQGCSALIQTEIKKFYDSHKIAKLYGNQIGYFCKGISTTLDVLDRSIKDWNQSAQITRQMIMINANQKEALYLLDTILNYKYLDSPILDTASQMVKVLEGEFLNQSEIFETELNKTAAEVGGELLLETVFKVMDGAFSLKVGSVYDMMGLVFNIFDYAMNWEGQVKAYHELRVYGALTLALSHSSLTALLVPGEELKSLRSLKYLIKVRLNGEKAYLKSAKDYADENDIVKKINIDQKINTDQTKEYKNLDEYYEAFSDQLLSDRDALFNKTYTIATIPKAPDVSIDYKNELTNESFGSDYEYSFDGVNWVMCMFRKIKLEPASISRYLWMRKKASVLNPAGNITKITIPSRSRITDEIKVKYKNGSYLVSGLSDGDYTFLPADNEKSQINGSGQKITVKNNTFCLNNRLSHTLFLEKKQLTGVLPARKKHVRLKRQLR